MTNQDYSAIVNDAARKIQVRGKENLIPMKFDVDGEIVDEHTPPEKLVLKRLTLNDLRFLKIWRSVDWDIDKAVAQTDLTKDKAQKFIRKLQAFREEDARVKALAEIPTPGWIAARQVENLYDGGAMNDSEHKSLQELAKISGAYKNTGNVSITQNVFNLPKLTPDIEAKMKELADQALDAELIQGEQAA